MIYGFNHVLPVYGFLKTCFMMVTFLNDYLKDDVDDDDFGYPYRVNINAQFKQGFQNKSFSLQSQEGKCDEKDTLQKKNELSASYY